MGLEAQKSGRGNGRQADLMSVMHVGVQKSERRLLRKSFLPPLWELCVFFDVLFSFIHVRHRMAPYIEMWHDPLPCSEMFKALSSAVQVVGILYFQHLSALFLASDSNQAVNEQRKGWTLF